MTAHILHIAALTILLPMADAAGADGVVLLADSSPVPLKIDRVTLVSRENDNSRFQLTLDRNEPFPHSYGKMGLLIGSQTIRFSSGGYHSPTNHTVGAAIHGQKLAQSIGRHFRIIPAARIHPGHRLVVRFKAADSTFNRSGPVIAELTIRNTGTRDFTFLQGGRQRGPRDNQFAFSCQHGDKMLPDTGNPMNFGGPGSYTTIAPGKTHTIKVDLTKWFKFPKPDTYFLRGSYYLEIIDPKEGSRTIWEDFVADEFSVTIR